MDIGAVKNCVDIGGSAHAVQARNPRSQPVVSVSTENTGDVADKSVTNPADGKIKKKPTNLQDVTQMTEAMNKFIASNGCKYKIHYSSRNKRTDGANSRPI